MSTSALRAAVDQIQGNIDDQLSARLLAERAVSQLQRDATALAIEERRQEYLLAKLDLLSERKAALQKRLDGAPEPVRRALARFTAQTDGELEAVLGELGAGPVAEQPRHLAPPPPVASNGRRRALNGTPTAG